MAVENFSAAVFLWFYISHRDKKIKDQKAQKTKELIAVGISVVMDCKPCMQWHIEQATKAGASTQEVLEAVEVGIEMGHGPTIASAKYALEVMEAVYKE